MAEMRSVAGEDREEAMAPLPDRLRLGLRFDPVRLREDFARIEGAIWTAHFISDNYDGDWSILPLRAPRGADHPILRAVSHPGITDWEDTDLLATCPYFGEVLAALACPVGAARLMRLAPGSLIREHRDADLAAEYGMARLHIPVFTNQAVDFRLNGTRVEMAPGETWYLRLADRHSVTNRGGTARIHLVIDAAVNDWLAGQLTAAAAV